MRRVLASLSHVSTHYLGHFNVMAPSCVRISVYYDSVYGITRKDIYFLWKKYVLSLYILYIKTCIFVLLWISKLRISKILAIGQFIINVKYLKKSPSALRHDLEYPVKTNRNEYVFCMSVCITNKYRYLLH